MGSSIAMIDRHYGHLARDSREHAVSLLDALAVERPWTLGGRRKGSAQSRAATAIPGLAGGDRGERWTFGGRRDSQPSSRSQTKGAEQQELRRAL
jgi:hypothetical protein